jgi:hypothetical protein
MTTPIRGAVANPIALQAALRARNADLRKSVLDDAMQGSGDRDLWMSKARSLATTTAMYACGVNLDLNAQRADCGATQVSDCQALASEDSRAHNELARLLEGSVGLAEWFQRAQQTGFVAARHAARASEYVDGSTVGPVGEEIRKGLTAALASSSGSGGVQYWCDATSNAVVNTVNHTKMTRLSEVARAAAQPGRSVSGVDFARVQARMHNIRERKLSALEDLAFGYVPPMTGQALQRTVVAGAHAMEMAGRLTEETATLRADLQAPDDATLADLAAKADEGIRNATRLGLQGNGTAQYWIECAAVMAAQASAHAALVASHCNAALLEEIRRPLDSLLSQTPMSADGEVHAMMKNAETTANAVIPAYQDLVVELRAAAAAQRAQASVEASEKPKDEKQLEVDKALQKARATLWDETLQSRSGELSQLQTRINDLSARIQPLADAQAKCDKTAGLASKVALGALAVAGGGGLLTLFTVPYVGVTVGALGVATLLASGIVHARSTSARNALQAEKSPLEQELSDIAPAWVTARNLANLAHERRGGAEEKLHKIDSQLEIHHMADAANHPVGTHGDASVHVDDDTVRIGNVVIHRRRISDNNQVPTG